MLYDTIQFLIGVKKLTRMGVSTPTILVMFTLALKTQCFFPMLAFSKHLICHLRILQSHCPLFEGSNQYDRFINILQDIVLSDEHKLAFM